jgi:hypothetical protein
MALALLILIGLWVLIRTVAGKPSLPTVILGL